MPYIEPPARGKFTEALRTLSANIEGPGELNYVVSMLVDAYVRARGERYSTFNEAVGVLESAKLELYRRRVAVYEDRKIEENGDVY